MSGLETLRETQVYYPQISRLISILPPYSHHFLVWNQCEICWASNFLKSLIVTNRIIDTSFEYFIALFGG